MNELSHILNNEIYPRVFEMADSLFPEFEFRREGSHWVSSNTHKIDGTHGDSKGKVYIYQDKPFLIKDYRSSSCEITKYLEQRGTTTSWKDSVMFLAQAVGCTINVKGVINQSPPIRTSLYEALNDLFVETLSKEPQDGKHWKYLRKRRYVGFLSCESSSANRMEIGVAPSRKDVRQHLLDRGFTEEEINDNYFYKKEKGKSPLEINKFIGDTHTLTIPYQDMAGRIIGFIVRNLDYKKGDEKPKYIVTSGLKRADKLFNLTLQKSLYKEVVLVEGILDALYAKALGMPNVLALGSAGFNKDQARLLKAIGVKRITLALDNDGAGQKALNQIIDTFTNDVEFEGLKIYVSSLPKGFKDPDELMREKGIESFEKVIKEAISWYNHKLAVLLNNISPSMPDKDRDSVIEAIMLIGSKLDRVELNHFAEHYGKLGLLVGLSADTLKKTLEDKKKKAQDERYKQRLLNLKSELEIATVNSDYEVAKEINSNISKHLNTGIHDNFIDTLLAPVTEEAFALEYRNEPPAVETSYKIAKLPLVFNAAALAFVVAPTGKGKTTTLINLALDMVRNHQQKVLLLTLEETTRALTLKALNTYIGTSLGKFKEDGNRWLLKKYYKTNDASNIANCDIFNTKKNSFFDLLSSNKLMIRNIGSDVDDIIKAIHALHERKLIDVVFIDYIQLIRISGRYASRQEEIKEIVHRLKECAHSTGLPFIIAGQFNRQATLNDEDTLTLTNIGEAGDIERIADIVMTVWFNDTLNQNGSYNFTMKILKNRDGINGLKGEFDYFANEGVIKAKEPIVSMRDMPKMDFTGKT